MNPQIPSLPGFEWIEMRGSFAFSLIWQKSRSVFREHLQIVGKSEGICLFHRMHLNSRSK
jgi:hypothetical protein